MPKAYKCKKCGQAHLPPTGKRCQMDVPPIAQDMQELPTGPVPEPAAAPATANDQVLAVLLSIQQRLEVLENRPNPTESTEQTHSPTVDSSSTVTQTNSGASANSDGPVATPDSLRRDMRLMTEAAERIAQLRMADPEDEAEFDLPAARAQGRKSGSQMVASGVVKKRIDWPHLYVQRMTAGKGFDVTFADLRLEEFVYGFLMMLKAPNNKWNKDDMLEILCWMMQDTMEFTWSNARGFYLLVGLAVEKGTLTWDNMDVIRDKRMTYARAVFPEKKEQKEAKQPTTKTPNAPIRCCAPYQTHSCEHQRDHHPFAHACAYCHRTINTVFRHPESDCQRKITDQAKNDKKRES